MVSVKLGVCLDWSSRRLNQPAIKEENHLASLLHAGKVYRSAMQTSQGLKRGFSPSPGNVGETLGMPVEDGFQGVLETG